METTETHTTIDRDTVVKIKSYIKKTRSEDLPENIQKLADIADSIIRYYANNGKISYKQDNMLEKFIDSIDSMDFNNKLKELYDEDRCSIVEDMVGIEF